MFLGAFSIESVVAASLQLLRACGPDNSPVARLAPVVWKAFNMHDALQVHIRNLPSDTTEAYKAWLERVAAS